MKQIIIIGVVIVILIALNFIFGNGSFEKEIDEYMYKKYDEHFTYIKEIDRQPGGGWSTHHIKSQNGDDVVVRYVKSTKKYSDNYYIIKHLNDFVLYVKNKLDSSVNIQNFGKYKFYIDDGGSCDDRINKDTTIEEVLSINSECQQLSYIDIYIPEEEEKEIIEDNIFKYFENLKVSITITVLKNSDYDILNSDKNGYIYDFITTDEISSGVNDNYRDFTLNPKVIYESKIHY